MLAGEVRIWQETRLLRSRRVTLSQAHGSVLCEGEVRLLAPAGALQQDPEGEPPPPDAPPATVRAETLLLQDPERTVFLLGGATVEDQGRRLEARELTLCLDPDDRRIRAGRHPLS